jgi:signal transduction histidine kinase
VVNELRTFHPEQLIELHVPPQLDAIFDDSRIAQVLSNLIGNAIQYGSPDLPVVVRVTAADGDVAIAVNNRGTTIPPDRLSAIFDPMVRIAASVNSDYAERTSLGIGLYISREIVHAHGGKVHPGVDRRRRHHVHGDHPAPAAGLPAGQGLSCRG